MRTALITTTIGIPRVLELYRAYGPNVDFFVAGDQKSPHEDVREFMKTVVSNAGVGARYIHPEHQREWKCSELIGWNCIQRRNIALLEALRSGAEIIVTIDDDNAPIERGYFLDLEYILGQPHAGLELTAIDRWVNHSALLNPPMRHRGIPRNHLADFTVTHATNRKVGVATGAVLGNPDIDAIERMAISPCIHGTSQLMDAGVFIDPASSWTVFNTQNTAFLRKFAPAMFVLPGVGRMDDILASLICQRVMREEGYCVHVGRPFVYQERHAHNLVKDLRAESDWYDRIDSFVGALNAPILNQDDSVIDKVRKLYNAPVVACDLPDKSVEAALAFLDDCEEVMK